MATRIPTIDIMKGIAIIAVIVGHIVPGESLGKELIFSFHMPLFFIVAGYLYKPSTSYRKKSIADFRRLIVPYLVVAFIFTIYILVGNTLLSGLKYSLTATLWGAAKHHHSLIWSTAPRIGAAWFLPALFWCRQIFNFCFTQVKYPYLTIVLVSLIGTVTDYYLINLPFALLPGMSAMIFYLIGYWVRIITIEKKLYILLFAIGLICWILHMRFSTLDMAICSYSFYPMDVIGALFATAGIYYISRWLSKISLGKILGSIGQITLYIFCIHAVEMEVNPYELLYINWGWYTEAIIRVTWCIAAAYLYVSIKKIILTKPHCLIQPNTSKNI